MRILVGPGTRGQSCKFSSPGREASTTSTRLTIRARRPSEGTNSVWPPGGRPLLVECGTNPLSTTCDGPRSASAGPGLVAWRAKHTAHPSRSRRRGDRMRRREFIGGLLRVAKIPFRDLSEQRGTSIDPALPFYELLQGLITFFPRFHHSQDSRPFASRLSIHFCSIRGTKYQNSEWLWVHI